MDEDVPFQTVQTLREIGYDVHDMRGKPDEGMKDALLWDIAQSEGRLLITTDKGFAGHRGDTPYGILVMRLRQPNRHKIHQRVIQVITIFDDKEWPDLLQELIPENGVESITN